MQVSKWMYNPSANEWVVYGMEDEQRVSLIVIVSGSKDWIVLRARWIYQVPI